MPVVRGRVRKSYRDSRILSLEKYCEGIGGGGRGNFVPFPFRVHLPRWAYAINLFAKRDTSIPIYLLFLIEINVGISNIRPFRNYSILEKIILRIGFKKKSERSEESLWKFSNFQSGKGKANKPYHQGSIVWTNFTNIHVHRHTRRSMPGCFHTRWRLINKTPPNPPGYPDAIWNRDVWRQMSEHVRKLDRSCLSVPANALSNRGCEMALTHARANARFLIGWRRTRFQNRTSSLHSLTLLSRQIERVCSRGKLRNWIFIRIQPSLAQRWIQLRMIARL